MNHVQRAATVGASSERRCQRASGFVAEATRSRGGLVGVAHSDQIDVTAGNEAGVGVGVFVDADGEDGESGFVVMELKQ